MNPNSPSKKRQKINEIFILLIVMKMPEAQLCYLPLGFNTLYRLDLLQYCDVSNCSNSLLINTDPIKVLACNYTYHKYCYTDNGFKCMYCLLFLQQVEVEDPENNILYDDDDESELIEYIAYILEEALEEALHKFQ
ncbi:12398_t:CDS:2 [Funneliformis caledonium]|uniref:12398_t:CDS:1 n=1 Tax=Funneliformis caledonium TaxID=1117310 RepID=A0A9N8VRL1_9GLOM|nr:12398_t:CDS:2 [Funneliformis caledonium]